jgi:hypothetical protein
VRKDMMVVVGGWMDRYDIPSVGYNGYRWMAVKRTRMSIIPLMFLFVS